MGTRRCMFTTVVTAAALLPAASAVAHHHPPRTSPPAPTVRVLYSATAAAHSANATRSYPPRHVKRRRGVFAHSATNQFWFNARGDCYNNGIVVDPSSQTFGARNGETSYYRALLWNGYAWAANQPWIEWTRSLTGDGAVVNGNYVNSLPTQSFSVGRAQYQRAAIQVYIASRGGYDWNWATTVPRAFSGAQSYGQYCYFP
jgi:hypothetical protein